MKPKRLNLVPFGTVPASGEEWLVTHDNYDGCVTNPGGHSFHHAHAVKNYGGSGVGGWCTTHLHNFTYTAADADRHFEQSRPDHDVATSATMAYNCHGYTTGKLFWIPTDYQGIVVVVNDEYESPPSPVMPTKWFQEEEGFIFQQRDHSYVLYSIGSCGSPSEYREKWNTSPVMKSSHPYNTVDNFDGMVRKPQS